MGDDRRTKFYQEMQPQISHRNLLFEGHHLNRSDMRLEGLEVYALIGALQASSSMALLVEFDGFNSINNTDGDGNGGATKWIKVGLLVVTLAATLGGVYVTMVFFMCSMYGKTALGLLRDDEYVLFMENTSKLRSRGFFAFTATLLLFGAEVVLLAGSKLAQMGPLFCSLIMAVSAGVVLAGWAEMNHLIELASPIYRKRPDQQDDLSSMQ
jgi:hypothetical protein